MRKFYLLAALTGAALALGSLTAQAGVAPSAAVALKPIADEAKAGGVEQAYYRRHHRRYYSVAPRYYGYRYYRRRH